MPAKIKFKAVLEQLIRYMDWDNVELQERCTFAQFQAMCVSYDITDRVRKQKELWHMLKTLELARDVTAQRAGALEVYIVNVGAIKAFLRGAAIQI